MQQKSPGRGRLWFARVVGFFVGGFLGIASSILTVYPKAWFDKGAEWLLDCSGLYLEIASDVELNISEKKRLTYPQLADLADKNSTYNNWCGQVGAGNEHYSQYQLDRLLVGYLGEDAKFKKRLCFGLYILFSETSSDPSDPGKATWSTLFESEKDVIQFCHPEIVQSRNYFE